MAKSAGLFGKARAFTKYHVQYSGMAAMGWCDVVRKGVYESRLAACRHTIPPKSLLSRAGPITPCTVGWQPAACSSTRGLAAGSRSAEGQTPAGHQL
eukprot:365184-Chlamydomonas_euryale.AAC.5